jgi:hypothetical protein
MGFTYIHTSELNLLLAIVFLSRNSLHGISIHTYFWIKSVTSYCFPFQEFAAWDLYTSDFNLLLLFSFQGIATWDFLWVLVWNCIMGFC